jgi:hypothetical protein
LQTAIEIQRMRREVEQHRHEMVFERQAMERRKAYIESMTAFLNTRIMELNKVKSNLKSEKKWLELTENKIAQLEEKQRLVKLHDIMTCLKNEEQFNTAQATQRTTMSEGMKAKADAITAALADLATKSEAIEKGGDEPPAAHHHHRKHLE